MSEFNRWLLPEGIDELLPPQAERLETLRRNLLDLYYRWGYDLVVPPLVEYLESLLTGTGHELDLQTFKITDQLSGRLMGVRADMTPQAARIEAHRLNRAEPTRLCYLGSVLHTHIDGFAASRSPKQVGAELFGHAGVESDLEILQLVVQTLETAGIADYHLDLGHVGLFGALTEQAGLSDEQEAHLFDALQRKASAEIDTLLSEFALDSQYRRWLAGLAELNGGVEVLDDARRLLDGAGERVMSAIERVEQLANAISAYRAGLKVYFDLAELRGYHYHTGVVFAAFVPGHGQEVIRGGRYDDIGAVFGRSRPAVGFSGDLRILMALGDTPPTEDRGIFAPADADEQLNTLIANLRDQGERVIRELPGQSGEAREMRCNRRLMRRGGGWEIVPI
ncbi:MAG: ATP phosphoribosyltransferase regulatory subunit [Chromatiales bacterium]|nr:ATP phosphoribosyltransferase regulatory subunit [Chromatiales bacterium]